MQEKEIIYKTQNQTGEKFDFFYSENNLTSSFVTILFK